MFGNGAVIGLVLLIILIHLLQILQVLLPAGFAWIAAVAGTSMRGTAECRFGPPSIRAPVATAAACGLFSFLRVTGGYSSLFVLS